MKRSHIIHIALVGLLVGGVIWVFYSTYYFTLVDVKGNRFSLTDFRGKVVVIEFMMTRCHYCNESMPGLKALWSKYEGRIVLISISIDPSYDTDDVLKVWVDRWNATWVHARDTATPQVHLIYGVQRTPTYVVVDKNGAVRYRHDGPTSENILSEEIDALLKE